MGNLSFMCASDGPEIVSIDNLVNILAIRQAIDVNEANL